MKKICAWCDKRLPPARGRRDTGSITHGICPDCTNYFFRDRGKHNLRELLDRLGAPVVAVDSTGRIAIANLKARDALKKNVEEVEGYLGGEAMECAYARLPAGCRARII